MIHQSAGYVVRDADGLIRPLCFTHAMRRALVEMIDMHVESRGESCGDCLRPREAPLFATHDLLYRIDTLERYVDDLAREIRDRC